MECSTKVAGDKQTNAGSEPRLLSASNWERIVQAVDTDLEKTARETHALQRARGIKTGSDLLRLVLMYALSGWSLRLVAAWAVIQSLGYLSDVAVLNRLRNCPRWIGRLIGVKLQQRCEGLQNQPGVRIRLMDASTISRQGSEGLDWRLHLSFDLGNMCMDGIELTDAHSGERLTRFDPHENEIRIADRGYAYARGLGPIIESGCSFIVRSNWQNLSLKTPGGERFKVVDWLKTLSIPTEQLVWLSTPQGNFCLRLIACPLPPAAVEEARRKARQRSQKKKQQVSEETLLAAEFVLLITNLSAETWSIQMVCALYRLRWQIEIAIKRLKSLFHIDHLRAQDPKLAQTFLLGNLLVALLLDDLTQQIRFRMPDWFVSLEHPVNTWRLAQFFLDSFRHLICGSISYADLIRLLPALQRYFCDTPRLRLHQLTWARALCEHFVAFPLTFHPFCMHQTSLC